MNIHVVNLSKYTQPEVVESPREEWVDYLYNDGQPYYQWLIDRYRNSATNNAVINNMARLIFGRGLYAKNASKRANDYAQMKALIPDECLKSVILDFKILGSGAFQIIYNKTKSKIVGVHHMPMHLLRPEKCDKDGNINAYYYSDNWEDLKNFPPQRVQAFTGEAKAEREVLVFGNYSIGRKYFHSVDYEGALDYALLEQEIAQYLINDVQNGFSGTKVINFNNGTPSDEQQRMIVNRTMSKLTGSMGEKVIIAFNDSDANKTTVDDIPLNDAPEHYQYLSEEARNKILVGHNVTSPMLLGISPDGQGFSSNAEEIDTASKYFHNTIIKHFQDAVISAVDKILAFNNISLDLYFRRLNLFEDIDEQQQQEEERNAELSEKVCCSKGHFNDDDASNALIQVGEDVDPNWMLLAEGEVNYDEEEKTSFLSKIWNFVSTGSARPNAKSQQDEVVDGIKFIVRYAYDGEVSSNSREFCRKMVQASKIYRKEDIIRMGTIPVNEGWGPEGASTYSIWLYKGGGMCRHKWVKRVYAAFEGGGIDVNNPNARTVAENTAKKYGYIVNNPNKVEQRPVDMPHFGFLPTNKIWGR